MWRRNHQEPAISDQEAEQIRMAEVALLDAKIFKRFITTQ